jgi:predicted dehydrogenase
MKSAIFAFLATLTGPLSSHADDLRLGIIGLDTSHATAFTEMLNDPAHKDHIPGARVVAAFPGGSPDIESSISRVPEYTAVLRDRFKVTICPTIEEVCALSDAILIESVDGRPHLAQARIVIAARKPLYIDKPLAGSLRDAITIASLAKAAGVPFFSSSSLRFAKSTQAVRNGSIGKVLSAETTSPSPLEKTHPDLFWYGIHGCESLFTVMGRGCASVTRSTTPDGRIEVRGTWENGRSGIFREDKTYSGSAQGEKGNAPVGAFDGYAPLVAEIVRFFQTGKPPVSADETIELLAFMEAADESKRRNGQPVTIAETMKANQPAP